LAGNVSDVAANKEVLLIKIKRNVMIRICILIGVSPLYFQKKDCLNRLRALILLLFKPSLPLGVIPLPGKADQKECENPNQRRIEIGLQVITGNTSLERAAGDHLEVIEYGHLQRLWPLGWHRFVRRF
jgi:hypothetical protein